MTPDRASLRPLSRLTLDTFSPEKANVLFARFVQNHTWQCPTLVVQRNMAFIQDLHDELALLVETGLSPMEALQAATLNPARYLGKDKDLGTVEKGKLADLVLLEANPLDDIHNSQKIEAVVFGGKLLPKAALQKMLDDLEAAARKE